jgi:hypothetical protein
VTRADLFRAFKVGARAAYLQNSIISACRQAQSRIARSSICSLSACDSGVELLRGVMAELKKNLFSFQPFLLLLSGLDDVMSDRIRVFGFRRRISRQLPKLNYRNVYVNIYTVE